MNEAESVSLEDALSNLPGLIRKRLEQLEEREKEFEQMKKTFEEENPSQGYPNDVLRLNVGGSRIDVLRRTLTSVEGSMLAAKFSGRWDDSLEKDADGNFFIDQPMELFMPMIKYLRAQACMTPRARPVHSPPFVDDNEGRDNFFRMLEYYGVTLGLYPYGIFQHGKTNDVSSGRPNYKVEADIWTTFLLEKMPGNNVTSVASYEIILGQSTSAQIEWASGAIKDANGDGKGIGYVDLSVALDFSRSGIAIGAFSSGSLTYAESFVSVPGVPLISEGTVIRSENKGRRWLVNGILVASANEGDGVADVSLVNNLGTLYPCFSLKGSLCVSSIELDY